MDLERGNNGEQPQNNETRYYGAPFDDDDADIILRSSDGVDFRTYKVILAKSSSFFKTMFSLPQPTSEPTQDNLLVISMSEPCDVVAGLLTAISPVPPHYAAASAFATLAPLLSAAQKYEMDSALSAIRLHALHGRNSLMKSAAAFRIYSIAWQYGLEEEMRRAARLTLDRPMSLEQYAPDLHLTSGIALQTLWRYRQECDGVMRTHLVKFQRIEDAFEHIAGGWWDHLYHICAGPHTNINNGNSRWIPTWWWDFFKEAGKLTRGTTPSVALSEIALWRKLDRHAVEDHCDACKGLKSDGWWERLQSELNGAIDECTSSFNFSASP